MKVPRRGARAKTRVTGAKGLVPKFKVWVVLGAEVKFGDGRADLLEVIDECGSIKNAVVRYGMSYRAVWGYFRELEKAAGFKFLARTPGSGPQSGTRLTNEAKDFLKRYREFRGSVQRRVESAFHRSFPSV